MKTSRNQMNPQNKQSMSRMPKPEIRDDLDSREMKNGKRKEMT
jgi:hypothetical protein